MNRVLEDVIDGIAKVSEMSNIPIAVAIGKIIDSAIDSDLDVTASDIKRMINSKLEHWDEGGGR